MNLNIKVSVVIPVFKTEQYLRRCIDSILQYDVSHIEIIIVNDGISKECESIVKEYQLQYSNIIMCQHKKNLGLLEARITGIKASQGEYIAFLDSDDYLYSDIYNLSYGVAKKENSQVVLFNVIEEDNGQFVSQHKMNTHKEQVNLKGKEALKNIFSSNCAKWIWFGTALKIVHKSIYIDFIKYFRVKRHLVQWEDILISIYIYLNIYNKKTISTISTLGIVYYRHEEAISRTVNYQRLIKKDLDTIFVLKKIKEFLTLFKVYKKYKKNYKELKILFLNLSAVNRPLKFCVKDYMNYVKVKSLHLFNRNLYGVFKLNNQKIVEHLYAQIVKNNLKEVIIFGIGEVGKLLHLKLLSNNIKVSFFMVSNKELEYFHKIQIIEPSKNVQDAIIIITSLVGSKSIEQLLELDISKDIQYISFFETNIRK